MLRHFALTVVAPAKKCDKEVASLVALCDVLDVFVAAKRQTKIEGLPGKATKFMDAHQAAYKDMYMKPKHHFAWHNADQLQRNVILDCWVHERKHKSLKRAAGFVANTSVFEASVLARCLLDQCRQLQ